MGERRFGLGFDAHPRDEGRPLRLGGIPFAGEPGLAGHSDGDVVCHALADALLGAGALGDIGEHFPDGAPETEGIAGPALLARAAALVRDAGLVPEACDLVVICTRPMLGPRREEIRSRLAEAMGIDPAGVSVKATRPEGLGLSGDGAACLAIAVVREP